MPPIPDKQLEERILAAARRLWREQGEKGLTLREVARAAGTTTPTVYKRFRNKEAIRLALALRFRAELNAEVFESSCVEEMYRRYLAYAEANPHEYELLRLSWAQLYSPDRPRPGRVWVLAQMAARFGGQPEDYGLIVDALFQLCHGTSTLLTVGGDTVAHEAMRETCIKACDRMIEHVEIFRSRD
ncbi:MAG: TetR/AcrR family transcriptional regulator [Terriglobales bacterium]